ncbi:MULTISPECIES: hypothetical protein [Pseudomonas]|uniref:Uncharacterized protein n=1 Tax=Pseudomonas fluorescens TaxID=294 RepID=A0A5E7RMD6_PSEFL|nr:MULTISPECIES: hypothetical protein [Pseudomonas]VVP75015.1 hypothetical protein PS922_01250 [Pseudomonas fluorescens]
MKPPTDLKILSTIYKLYYEEFKNHSRKPGIENGRETKIFVPIDCKMIAKELDVDGDIVYGRLYYHLEQKHGYTRSDGSNVAFFSMMVGSDRHCVNFPLLASVLAGLQEESSKFQLATWLSTFAIVISLASLALGK